ncbi:ABC transporter permease [Streptococcus cuniculi]|uniref:ABC transporter permease n=1 Tax=Streptococcus cuniculi TaxID=1432788 RepID=A0A4Y9J9M5_9STRE|nr:ABC transporter permease [Streptococcus cuniculi]MBF0779162.1 ABC transporter permease [Streptococcus cuniculi]TFU96888.1 ABC transporter permease [Streptococcus cuniculi]
MAIVHSEWLKIRHSYAVLFLVGFSLLEYITIPAYLAFVPSSYALEAAIYFPMLANCLVYTIISILLVEQESQANHFQYIRSEARSWCLWGAKFVLVDGLSLLPTMMLWWFIATFVYKDIPYLAIGLASWGFTIFVYHVHLVLSLFLAKGVNFAVAFIECLLVLFASNRTFLGHYWCPIVLPANFIISLNRSYLLTLCCWIVGMTCVAFCLMHVKRYRV